MSARTAIAAAGVLALAAAATAAGSARYHGRPFPDGAPPGTTGGFGEATCALCHLGAELNDPAGSLAIEGLPERYTPGQAYRLIVRLRRADLAAAGFQLSARTAAGAQAGTLAGADSATEIRTHAATGVQYAGHTRAGSRPAAPGAGEWVVTWTAPAPAGPVTFHAAANAADGDASPLGDYVYSLERASQAP
ncbi:MAG TPA: choice-of-anchor V domain-containing protein [Longimicrobium sp.]|nr:choice-of-anchor V domain-containing protein [Longimicrobium sp.]